MEHEDEEGTYFAYVKVINGENILSVVHEYLTPYDETKYKLISPLYIQYDYEGDIDPEDFYLVDWLPANIDKIITLSENKILGVLPPTEHAVKAYWDYIKATKEYQDDEEFITEFELESKEATKEKTNIVSLNLGRRPDP